MGPLGKKLQNLLFGKTNNSDKNFYRDFYSFCLWHNSNNDFNRAYCFFYIIRGKGINNGSRSKWIKT